MNQFFNELAEIWVRAAAARGAEVDPPQLTPELADELLELARVAAHTQERRFAPLVSFTAGVAAERLRAARPGCDLPEYVRAVREQLEQVRPQDGG